MSSRQNGDPDKPWRFVTNHTQVLLAIVRNPDVRTRDIAEAVGITERAAQRIVADLNEAGYIETTRTATPRPSRPGDRRAARPPETRSEPLVASSGDVLRRWGGSRWGDPAQGGSLVAGDEFAEQLS